MTLESLTSPFGLLVLANIIAALSWFGKGLYDRLHNVEKQLPQKVEMNTFNATVDSIRKRQDENTDKLATQLTSLERAMAERHINMLSAIGRGDNHKP